MVTIIAVDPQAAPSSRVTWVAARSPSPPPPNSAGIVSLSSPAPPSAAPCRPGNSPARSTCAAAAGPGMVAGVEQQQDADAAGASGSPGLGARRVPRTDVLLADPRIVSAERRLGRPLVKAAIARAQQRARAGDIPADPGLVADE